MLAACLAVLVPGLWADQANFVFDDYWKQKAEEAKKSAFEAFDPNPEEVADGLNYHVDRWVHQS